MTRGGRASEDKLGQRRMLFGTFPLLRRPGARRVPESGGHSDAPEIMEEAGAPHRHGLTVRQAQSPCHLLGQRRDPVEWPRV